VAPVGASPGTASPAAAADARIDAPTRTSDRRVALWLLVVMAASFLIFQQGAVTGYDGGSMYAVTRSIVDHGTLAVSDEWNTLPGRDGRAYARYGLGLSLVAAVPYALVHPLASLSGRPQDISAAAVSSVMPLIVAGLIAALYLLARRLGGRAGPAILVALGGVVGTFILPYGKEFFSEPLATLFLVVAIERVLAGRPGASGLAAGAAVLTRAQALLFAPLVVVVAWRRGGVASAGRVLIGLAPGVVATLTYNVVRFGGPLEFGYQDVGFTTPPLRGIGGLLFEPTKSVLLFAPIVLLLPAALWYLWRTNRDAAVLLGGNLGITIALTATWFSWHGGWCWGPRLLLPGLVPAVAAIGPWVSSVGRLRAATALFAAGCLVSLPALLVSTQAQQLEVASPPPWTHYLDTQPLASPSIARQFTLLAPTIRYSAAHLYEDRGDGKNNLRSLALWQFAIARALGRTGVALALAGTAFLSAVAVASFARLRGAYRSVPESTTAGDTGVRPLRPSNGRPRHRDPSVDASGGENLEAMEAARNYNAHLTDTLVAVVGAAGPVLDFGAGTGTHARALRERGVDVRCVEPDTALRDRLTSEGFATVASADALPPGSFGSAYSLNVLEHIDDDEAALRAIARVVRPGGPIVLYVPAFEVLYSDMDRSVGHVRRYKRGALISLTERSGLHVTRCVYVDSLGFLAALLYRAMNGSGRLRPRSVGFYDRFLFPLSRVIDRATDRWFGKNLLLEAHRG
jgi:SAM-dependent methyltransferase